jgi:hypothetical protein
MLIQLHIIVNQTSQPVSKLPYNLKKKWPQDKLTFLSREISKRLEPWLPNNKDMRKLGKKSIKHLLKPFNKELETRCSLTSELEKECIKTIGT